MTLTYIFHSGFVLETIALQLFAPGLRLKVRNFQNEIRMKTLGNIIWIIFGGLHIALEYFIAGLILMITIIGIPFGLQSLKLGMLAIWPFGTKVKWKPSQPGCLSIFMNVLWFFVGGIWIWLTHVFYGIIFCITIIGIPFGKMHFRLAKLALSPFGKELVQYGQPPYSSSYCYSSPL